MFFKFVLLIDLLLFDCSLFIYLICLLLLVLVFVCWICVGGYGDSELFAFAACIGCLLVFFLLDGLADYCLLAFSVVLMVVGLLFCGFGIVTYNSVALAFASIYCVVFYFIRLFMFVLIVIVTCLLLVCFAVR